MLPVLTTALLEYLVLTPLKTYGYLATKACSSTASIGSLDLQENLMPLLPNILGVAVKEAVESCRAFACMRYRGLA